MPGQGITDHYRKEVTLLIATLRSMDGLPVFQDTNEFDPEYPYLIWDKDMITQCKKLDDFADAQVVDCALEFLSHFNANNLTTETVKINEEHDAIVTMKYGKITIKVGCQTVPVESVKRLNEVIARLQRSAEYKKIK
jgi:hypothetical protein